MAYNVTSQWDDIHRRLGNYEELPVEKKQGEYTQEALDALDKHDALKDKTMEQLEEMEDDVDEEFLEIYKKQRLQELAESKKGPQFSGIREITRQDYIDEVTNAHKGTYVVLHLFQSYVEACEILNKSLFEMSEKYPHIKFLKIVASKCIENYPDKNVPTIIIYLNGQMLVTLPRIDQKYRKLTVAAMEDMLRGLSILPTIDNSEKKKIDNLKSSF